MIQEGAADLGVEAGEDDVRHLSTVVNALGNGLAMEKTINPDAVPDELFGITLAVLFEALARAAAPVEEAP
jgi:hypothetical protein